MQGVEYMKTNFAKASFLQCIFCLTKIYPDAGIVKRYVLITQKVILASYWAINYKCGRAFQNISKIGKPCVMLNGSHWKYVVFMVKNDEIIFHYMYLTCMVFIYVLQREIQIESLFLKHF